MTVAALYVQRGGCYFGLPDVDPWDEARDARLYAGPHPVVAHPPCSRWCRLAGLVEARWGHKKGDDGGCFASALASVRRVSGVLEHPAYSDAWAAFGLPVPPVSGGWTRGICGGWTAHVEQGHYGHPARKATWLYAVGVDLPALRWGSSGPGRALVSASTIRTNPNDSRPRIYKAKAAATPPAFRDILLDMARSAARRAA
jgi:hypothetical protein